MKRIQLNKGNPTIFNISINLINSSEKLKDLYKNIGSQEINITTISDTDKLFFEKFIEYYDKKNNNNYEEITNRFIDEQKQYIIDLMLFLDNYKFTKISEILKQKITNVLKSESIDNIRNFLDLENDLTIIEKNILDNDIKNDSNNFNDVLFLANLSEINDSQNS
ncbi:hypothetical protein Hokovirus_4_29 [Hokovirus HKV1]|uniref:Uncharacterized protein n=1 Tax=Hokovirus HKV1 TaxID=1977638 RepID=A0A1V0SH54_9VIRU|nr:hypothetical protein Hokovirus_4_29 [Hokovirus HKV1]